MIEFLGEVRAGFIPLIDCAPLVVAKELGLAEAEGVQLTLLKETSWATIRDRLAVSHLDAAHMLAPMPVAANLKLGPLPTSMVVPMALGTGGNAVCVSNTLWEALKANGAPDDFDARLALKALVHVVREREAAQLPRLTLGIVHPFSAHHYELAYWLGAGGLLPGTHVDLVVVPPPLTPAALASGRLDGFCAGEPWGSVVADEGTGVILTTNSHIWCNSPEKVLGVRQAWADDNKECLAALIRAIYRAATWCDLPENQDELAVLLSDNRYVSQGVDRIRPSLARRLRAPNGDLVPVEGFLNFASKAATFPWSSHALWFYTQMVRWGQAPFNLEAVAAARSTYRPDLYRAALRPLKVEVPSANAKVEGALTHETPAGSPTGNLCLGPDAFFDGTTFDPDHLEDYVAKYFSSND
jgi:two-component system, oxyanion-binding sensor